MTKEIWSEYRQLPNMLPFEAFYAYFQEHVPDNFREVDFEEFKEKFQQWINFTQPTKINTEGEEIHVMFNAEAAIANIRKYYDNKFNVATVSGFADKSGGTSDFGDDIFTNVVI